MPFPNDFAPPVTGQPAPFATTAKQPTASASDHAPPTGQSPDKPDPTDTDPDVDLDFGVIVEAFHNADVTVAATAMPGTAIVSLASTVYTNLRKYEVCFFAPRAERTVVTGSVDTLKVTLNVDGGATTNDPWARLVVPASVSGGGPLFLRSRFQGDGNAHTYQVVAYASFANEFVIGTGGDQIQIYARYTT